MCGRFTLACAPAVLARHFQLEQVPALVPRYNIAPTQRVPTVRLVIQGGTGQRALHLLQWGLIPAWAKDRSMGSRMINARAESVAEKPAFRLAYRKRRCLVMADGFYEWQRGERGAKQPYVIRLPEGGPFAFAGLWERWIGPNGTPLESCSVLTTSANEVVAPIHERMPVILAPEDYARWLDPSIEDPAQLQSLLRPYAGPLVAHPVSVRVNSPEHDSAECIAPLGPSRREPAS